MAQRVVLLLLTACVAATAFTVNPVIPSPASISNVSPVQRTRPLYMATWSDSKAVMDYQKFLASGKQEIELARDGPCVILRPYDESPNNLADALVAMGGGDDLVLEPGQPLPIPADGPVPYPIYVTLPPYQLEYFLRNMPESYQDKVEDFVFFSGGLQYGNIEDVLKERGYCRDSMTQVLISGLAVRPNNVFEDLSVNIGMDSNGLSKTAGECAACGKWAGAIAERLQRNNILCKTDFYRDWRRKMWERNVFDAVFNLIGTVRDVPTTVADVANFYGEEISEMVWDMSQLLRGWRAITLPYGFEERINAIGEFRGKDQLCTIVSEMYPYMWGNQVFLQSKQFVEYLQYAQSQKGMLPGIELPQKSDEEFASHMRKGVLRADGVV